MTLRSIWRALLILVFLAAGFAVGRWTAPLEHARHEAPPVGDALTEETAEVWTCSMHPQIRMPGPGSCPICGMKLVAASETSAAGSLVVLSPAAQRVASIEVDSVRRRPLDHEVRTVGRIDYSEPNLARLSARVAGRIERLYADYTGVEVKRGDHLVDIYSPELVVAQEEFLISLRAALLGDVGRSVEDQDRARTDLARQKLLLLGVSIEQIADLESSGRPQLILTMHAPIGGTVVEKGVREGAYVEKGEALYTIADLSHVWVLAEIYEYELPWIARGQRAEISLEALPGERFEGTVGFIDPRVDDATRTIKVRLHLDNSLRLLKPGMFAGVRIRAPLGPDGKRAPSPIAGKYTCPMHPEVVTDDEGICPTCGMALLREPGEKTELPPAPRYECPMHPEVVSQEPGDCPKCEMQLERVEGPVAGAGLLAVPATAILDSGARRIVWVEREPGRYESAEVDLGPRAGTYYPVLSGLKEGDRVVVHGGFLLDSQSQIEGKPSLLFPRGLETGPDSSGTHSGHDGH